MTLKKTWFKWFFWALLFSLIAIFQASFISPLPLAVSALSLPLVILIFCLLFMPPGVFLPLAMLMGFWLDILNFEFFGLHLISLPLTVFFLYLLLTNVVTNRSLYSFLLLALSGSIFYNFFLYTFLLLAPGGLTPGFFLGNASFWRYLGTQIIWSVGLMLLLFNLVSGLSKKFQPVFLEKK
ncbi:MAG: hypothetical protein JST_000464 [Candidatus Parcubacteria bacterium]|nr:MAG: hypothetical protein JST_4310 [Candidatus Parcubacteria bacterium]